MLKKYFFKGASALVSLLLNLTSVAPNTSAVKNEFSDAVFKSGSAEEENEIKIKLGAIVLSEVETVAINAVPDIIYGKVQINQINKEIQKYKNHAPDIFEIDDNVVRVADSKVLLITLRQFNKLLDKYKEFTQELIGICGRNNRKFTIKFRERYEENIVASTNLYGIEFSQKYYTDIYRMCGLARNVVRKFWSPTDSDKIIESVITHEFAHLMENLYCLKESSRYRERLLNCGEQICNDTWDFSNELPEFTIDGLCLDIKAQIISYANGDILLHIGRRAQKDSEEFFAETFATMECSTDPQYEYIRNAVKRTVSSWSLK